MNLTKRCSLRRCSMTWFQNKATRLSGIKCQIQTKKLPILKLTLYLSMLPLQCFATHSQKCFLLYCFFYCIFIRMFFGIVLTVQEMEKKAVFTSLIPADFYFSRKKICLHVPFLVFFSIFQGLSEYLFQSKIRNRFFNKNKVDQFFSMEDLKFSC